MGESQNERDRRVEELWRKLDPAGHGELDLKGLQKGLKRIDHRERFFGRPRSELLLMPAIPTPHSHEKCRRYAQGHHATSRH